MDVKPFVPVVTGDMAAAGHGATRVDIAPRDCVPVIAAALAHPDFAAQLRTYAAKVARQMVREPATVFIDYTPTDLADAEGFNRCRAETLSAIDEWEKNV